MSCLKFKHYVIFRKFIINDLTVSIRKNDLTNNKIKILTKNTFSYCKETCYINLNDYNIIINKGD